MMNRLRVETRELHEEIEKENLAGLVMSNTIDLKQYKLLLLQNYVAYKITESEISRHLEDFSSVKSEQLQKDLDALGVDYSVATEYQDEFHCSGKAEALGAAYVVEGSALGGMVISRQIKNCSSLSKIENHYFFNGERDNLKNWKSFSKNLDGTEFTIDQEEQAIEMAKETFRFFGKVFREVQLPS